MNATLKSICALLRQPDPQLQRSAILVLGAIRCREPGVQKSVGEALVLTDDEGVIEAVLTAIEQNPHEQTLKYLLKLLETSGPEQDERALAAIAKSGGKAVLALRRHFERVPSPVRRKIVRVLPRIQTPQAHAFLVDCFFDADHELVRESVAAIREKIGAYGPKERNDLYIRLVSALKDKRLKQNEAALSAIVISLGILADPRAKERLLPYLHPDRPAQVRRHALMSLARLELSGDKHHDVFEALLPILAEADYEGVVRHAVQVLGKIRPQRADNQRIRELLTNPHSGVVAAALQMLGHLDSGQNAAKVLEFLGHADPTLRDAAQQALRRMPGAVAVILERLEEEANLVRLADMVRLLEHHPQRVEAERAKALVGRLLELLRRNDERWQLFRTALRHLRPDLLQEEVIGLAKLARQKKDFAGVRDHLRILDQPELITPEIRYQLAVAKLKTGSKDRSRNARLSDYCLEHFARLLHDDPKRFPERLFEDRQLDAEDLLYVGFHFAERMNEERRFGGDVLRHILKRWPRSQTASVARQKLKVEAL